MASIHRCAPRSWLFGLVRLLHCLFCQAIGRVLCALAACAISTYPLEVYAVTPESPEVRSLIDQGLSYLEKKTDSRLGGKCLIALAFHKNGASLSHPRIREAIEACQAVNNQQISSLNNYSIGLAIIFLAEIKDAKHRSLITQFADAMSKKQKPHGGWGYPSTRTGDTSQTQYAVLSYWELLQSGMTPKVDSVENCLNWLLRTQAPEGGWGYQGHDPGNTSRIKQNQTTLSMAAAGLGSTMILANVLGLSDMDIGAAAEEEKTTAPSALRLAESTAKKRGKRLSGNGVDRKRLATAIKDGQAWFNDISKEIGGSHPCYVLYSIERYKSFEELLSSNIPSEPEWYQRGYEYLKNKQHDHGGWGRKKEDTGAACETAFAVLFLMRSTQKSIRASLGEGTLVGGRGLQADLSRMKIDRGRLVAKPKTTQISNLLGMLNDSSSEDLEQLLSNPNALRLDHAGPEDSRRLQQIVKSGVPEARILSVRVLAQQRNLDHVPILLYAMTDPDKRVVREARDGLRFISRRFGGFGLSDNFSDSERYDAIDKWKRWYRRLRPNAPPLP
ncbi:MAG: hypothetical protein GXP26_11380 [Planctomycetes bacterium]|nr:hypothetical protein [Planctomycetota bacterium]